GSRKELLQSILFDLSLPHDGQTEQDLRLRLTDFLLKTYGEGRRTVLVVDEAQHLSPDLLEELRLLGNLEAGRRKALQVVLAALEALAAQRLVETPSHVEYTPEGPLPAAGSVPGIDGPCDTMILGDDEVREEPPKSWPNEPTPICRLFDGKRRENGNGQNN